VLAAASPIDRLQAGAGPTRPLAPGADLEPLVEAEALGLDWAGAVTAGQHWLAALGAVGLHALAGLFREAFPVPDPDPAGLDREAGLRFRVLRRAGLDGAALLAAIRDPDGAVHLPMRPTVPVEHQQRVLEALRDWAAWYPQLDPVDAWVDDRLEYRFQVAAADPGATGDLVLSAPAYQGGRLDWLDFQGASAPVGAGGDPQRFTHAGLPTRVAYPGMPANRWWELEDGGVAFPLVEAEGGDIARMLLIEFAAVFGNDWFVAPLDIRFGTVVAVEGVVVLDTFGQAQLVSPADAPHFRMFEVSGAPPGRLVLPSVLAGSIEGAPIEEVQLTRDEMANLGWAIERTVLGAAGHRINRYERWRDRLADRPERAPDNLPNDVLVYDLANEPPDHWIPLVPVAAGPRAIRLQRGVFLRGDAQAFPPLGRFLDPSRPFTLFEEEVPRSGLMLTRSWQLARSADGRLQAWIGRRARPGRGESRSQVTFDRTRPANTDPA
jgi:hypothetical protein